MEFNSDFSHDLQLGKEGEERIARILSIRLNKVEVKRDLKAHKTGNVYFEYESRGKASGISTTHAELIYIIIEGSAGGLFFETEKLRSALRPLIETHTRLGGDNNTSKGILISIQELMKLCPPSK